MPEFDPNAAARPGSGVFGLPHGRDDADCLLLPVPFDATTSFRDGARLGPAAVLEASRQVDLFDLQTGKVYQRGIHMIDADPKIAELCATARAAAAPVISKGGAEQGDRHAVTVVDAAGAEVNAIVGREVTAILTEGKLPGVVGGDHSVPLGAIEAAAAHHGPIGILHVDAHADLRRGYQGFRWSHASIMDNVLRDLPGVVRIAQVGVRDLCEEEMERIHGSGGRVMTWFDIEWKRRLAGGESLIALCDEVIAALPDKVWISFDVDGLDPALCPHTGTPVPGGLSFADACLLLEAVQRGGRRIVGFDLDEVAPGEGGDDWDANVGARLLYKLCGFGLLTN